MKVIYAGKVFDISKGGIFLAGPTPRSKDVKSWRPKAIEYLKDYNGYVFCPEPSNGVWGQYAYKEQIEWEYRAMKAANIILFWIPRNLETMPAFTTNIEFGYWMYKNPKKLLLGFPKNAPKMKYMRYYAKKLYIPIFHTLKDICSYYFIKDKCEKCHKNERTDKTICEDGKVLTVCNKCKKNTLLTII